MGLKFVNVPLRKLVILKWPPLTWPRFITKGTVSVSPCVLACLSGEFQDATEARQTTSKKNRRL